MIEVENLCKDYLVKGAKDGLFSRGKQKKRAVSKAEEKQYELTLRAEEVADNYLELQKVYEEQKALEDEIAHLYTVWETLAAELEEMKA